MKKFLRQLKSLKPEVSQSLQQRILRDVKPSIVVKRSFSLRSFCVGSAGGICVGLLLGMVLFSSVKPPQVVENPPIPIINVEPIPQTTPPPTRNVDPLELDRLIAQLAKRNRAWEKTTIPAYSVRVWNRPDIERVEW